MKVQKTTFSELEARREMAWFALSQKERMEWHRQMLFRIYGERIHEIPTGEACKVKIKRGKMC
jgi:hypothetical protein